MKIAILVNLFPPESIGGVAISAQSTALYLLKRGHEVHVLTILRNDVSEKNTEENFYVHRIPRKKIKVYGNLIFSVQILKKLKDINPDIIHVEGLWMGLQGYLAKKILKIPYIVTGHGSDIYLQSKTSIYLKSKPVIKYADAVIALTDHMKGKIESIYKREVFIVPNGINLKEFENNTKYYMKEELKILFVGSLVPVKGIKYLIKAMKIMRDNYLNAKLIIIGDGAEKNELEKFVEDYHLHKYVFFNGKVPNDKIPQYMKESDIFVLPSLSEGFGIVLLEAMASGLPIVASNVGGIPSIIQDGVNGFLVDPRNPEKIAEKVIFLFNNNDLMNRISENNKAIVKQYDWEKIVIQIEDVYLKCLLK